MSDYNINIQCISTVSSTHNVQDYIWADLSGMIRYYIQIQLLGARVV